MLRGFCNVNVLGRSTLLDEASEIKINQKINRAFDVKCNL